MNSPSHIHIYTSLGGHAIGVGSPDSLNPKTESISLLCAVTFVPVPLQVWLSVISSHDSIEQASREVMSTYGGILLLVPSDIHLCESARSGFTHVVDGVH